LRRSCRRVLPTVAFFRERDSDRAPKPVQGRSTPARPSPRVEKAAGPRRRPSSYFRVLLAECTSRSRLSGVMSPLGVSLRLVCSWQLNGTSERRFLERSGRGHSLDRKAAEGRCCVADHLTDGRACVFSIRIARFLRPRVISARWLSFFLDERTSLFCSFQCPPMEVELSPLILSLAIRSSTYSGPLTWYKVCPVARISRRGDAGTLRVS